jgi:hypothetical protein
MCTCHHITRISEFDQTHNSPCLCKSFHRNHGQEVVYRQSLPGTGLFMGDYMSPWCFQWRKWFQQEHMPVWSLHTCELRNTVYRNLACVFAVSMAMGYAPKSWGSIPGRSKDFLYSTASRLTLGPTHPPIQWVLGALSQGWLGHEADHSPPFSVKVIFMALCLINLLIILVSVMSFQISCIT